MVARPDPSPIDALIGDLEQWRALAMELFHENQRLVRRQERQSRELRLCWRMLARSRNGKRKPNGSSPCNASPKSGP